MHREYTSFSGKGKDTLLHRNLKICTDEGIFATPFVIISVPGNLVMAALLTETLNIAAGSYGWIVSLPSWFNALQIFIVPMLARYASARLLTITLSVFNAILWLGLTLALPYLPLDDPKLTAKLIFLFFIFIALTQSIMGVSWMSWIGEWVPARIRGKYFGRRNSIIGMATVIFVLIIGHVLDHYGTGILGFQIILGCTGVMRLVSIHLMTYIYTPWSKPEPLIHEGWKDNYRQVLSHRPFTQYLGFAMILGFSLSFSGPFTPIFMREFLGFPVTSQIWLLILANATSALGMRLWGPWIDRYGCKTVIAISGLLWMLQNYLWVILTPETNFLLYPMWIWGGFMSGGVILGSFNMILKLTPPECKSSGISLHLGLTSLAAAIAPIIGGSIIALGNSMELSGSYFYRAIFLISPTLPILAIIFLLQKVEEPAVRNLPAMSGAFRTLRQSLILNGIFVFGNWSLQRAFKPKPRSKENNRPKT